MHHARIINHNIQPAESFYTRLDGSLPVFALGRIAGEIHSNHFGACCFVESVGDAFAVFGVDFEEQDASAFGDEFGSDAFA
jgi:hypothetical protein